MCISTNRKHLATSTWIGRIFLVRSEQQSILDPTHVGDGRYWGGGEARFLQVVTRRKAPSPGASRWVWCRFIVFSPHLLRPPMSCYLCERSGTLDVSSPLALDTPLPSPEPMMSGAGKAREEPSRASMKFTRVIECRGFASGFFTKREINAFI